MSLEYKKQAVDYNMNEGKEKKRSISVVVKRFRKSFPGRIRTFPGLGCNDNPTMVQFNAAYRFFLFKLQFLPPLLLIA